MKYLVIEIQKSNNGQVSQIVTSHAERAEAEQKYHTVLAYASVSTCDVHSAVMLTDEGDMIKKETYYHGQPEPEEEE